MYFAVASYLEDNFREINLFFSDFLCKNFFSQSFFRKTLFCTVSSGFQGTFELTEKMEEETYSSIFTALKHPVRRGILRMLSEQPMSFSDVLGKLTIDSAHLSYHLGNLGSLVFKNQDEKYQLSYVGRAALNLMYGIEEPKKEITKNKPTHNLARLAVIILITALILTGAYLTSVTAYEQMYSLPTSSGGTYGKPEVVKTDQGNVTFTTYIWTRAPPPEGLVIDRVSYIAVKCLFSDNITQGTQGIYNVTIRYLEYSTVDGAYIPKEKIYAGWFSPTEMQENYIFRGFVDVPGTIGVSETQQPIVRDIVVTAFANTSGPITREFDIEAPRYGNAYMLTQPYRAMGFEFIAAGTVLCVLTLATALFILPWWKFREITRHEHEAS